MPHGRRGSQVPRSLLASMTGGGTFLAWKWTRRPMFFLKDRHRILRRRIMVVAAVRRLSPVAGPVAGQKRYRFSSGVCTHVAPCADGRPWGRPRAGGPYGRSAPSLRAEAVPWRQASRRAFVDAGVAERPWTVFEVRGQAIIPGSPSPAGGRPAPRCGLSGFSTSICKRSSGGPGGDKRQPARLKYRLEGCGVLSGNLLPFLDPVEADLGGLVETGLEG